MSDEDADAPEPELDRTTAEPSTDDTGDGEPTNEKSVSTDEDAPSETEPPFDEDDPEPAVEPGEDPADMKDREPRTGDASSEGDDNGDQANEEKNETTAEPTNADVSTDGEAYSFEHIPREHLPPEIQYTPEFDDEWVYPSGAKAGGTRDHIPVQGLEIGVLSSVDTVQQTVLSVLDALEDHYEATGGYPRHRVVRDADSFRSIDGIGLVAVIQPRPDEYDGVMGHMEALRAEGSTPSADFTPNTETARELVKRLRARLDPPDGGENSPVTDSPVIPVPTDLWTGSHQIGETQILERYGPLASDVLFDPSDGAVDFDGPGVKSVDQLGFKPEYIASEGADRGPPTD